MPRKPKTLARRQYEKFQINNGKPARKYKQDTSSPEYRAARARLQVDNDRFEEREAARLKEVWEE